MFERYPNSENPLKEPAIVLIDELDLHLHPRWQRQIINYLTNIFSQTQFIVTTHSPFIIQSIEKINLFILNRDETGIVINHPKFKTFKGWTIEEILDEIHGLGEKTKSENYLTLIKQFDIALDSNDYEAANRAYVQLCDILHPTSPERKLLKVQLSQIVPND
jgi:predicted ATP-binding protein involved in virulence